MAYTNAQLQQLLQGAGQFGINQFGGPSFNDQRRNANAQMKALNSLNIGTDISQEQFDAEKSGIQSSNSSAIAGGIVAGLGGITDILNNTFNMAQIADTSGMENQIAEVGQIGNQQYSSFDQLNSDYNRLAASPMNFDYKDIRGKTNGELVGGVLSSTMSGAATGLTVGGPYGALAGAVVGLGSGIGGVIAGNNEAKRKQAQLALDARVASETAQQNLSLANENMMDYNFRAGVSNRAKFGGQINREITIQEFAARALRKPKVRASEPRGFVRQHTEGGTMIRFKR